MNNSFFHINKQEILQSKTLGFILTIAAGFMGVYSYLLCGQIFSNGLTGNLLFFSINLLNHDTLKALRYLAVVVTFSFGVAFTYSMRYIVPKNKFIYFRQVNILIEILLLFIVILVPDLQISHLLITFACGIQIENYEKIRGLNVSSVNFVGNTKIGAHELCEFFKYHKVENLQKALEIYMLMLAFVLGASLGILSIKRWDTKSLYVCILILLAGFVYTFFDEKFYPSTHKTTPKC